MPKKQTPDHAGLTNAFMHPSSAPRYAVDLENERVHELLDEPPQIDTYDHMPRSKKIGRKLIETTGLAKNLPPYTPERPGLEQSQYEKNKDIAIELEVVRSLLHDNLTEEDNQKMDLFLGIVADDTKATILPNSLKTFFEQGRKDFGDDLTFLGWATNHASDEQLLNILQWNDDYLRSLDEADEFKERATKLKDEYRQGLDSAIKKGLLHPSLAASASEMNKIPIRHASPLSPIIAEAHGYIDTTSKAVHVRPHENDFTFYHELTHLRGSGFVSELEEGRTDLIAEAIYNEVYDEPLPQEELVPYAHQIGTLAALERLVGEKANLFQLSKLSSEDDATDNTLALLHQVDDSLGFPLLEAAILHARQLPYDDGGKDFFINNSIVAVEILLSKSDVKPKDIQELGSLLIENWQSDNPLNATLLGFCGIAVGEMRKLEIRRTPATPTVE